MDANLNGALPSEEEQTEQAMLGTLRTDPSGEPVPDPEGLDALQALIRELAPEVAQLAQAGRGTRVIRDGTTSRGIVFFRRTDYDPAKDGPYDKITGAYPWYAIKPVPVQGDT